MTLPCWHRQPGSSVASKDKNGQLRDLALTRVDWSAGVLLGKQVERNRFISKEKAERMVFTEPVPTSPSSSSTSRKSKSLKTRNCCSLLVSSMFSCSRAPSSDDTRLVWCSSRSRSPHDEKITCEPRGLSWETALPSVVWATEPVTGSS